MKNLIIILAALLLPGYTALFARPSKRSLIELKRSSIKNKIRKAYDAAAKNYAGLFKRNIDKAEDFEIYRRLNAEIDVKNGKVLDIGCGTGEFIRNTRKIG